MAEEDTSKMAEYAAMQNTLNLYKQKLDDLQKKIYQGRSQGVNIKMYGDYSIIETTIDQSFYEIASKAQIEKAYLNCLSNLHSAIETEKMNLQEQLNKEIERFRVEAMNKQANGSD
jgi:DNA-binding protein YbaB